MIVIHILDHSVVPGPGEASHKPPVVRHLDHDRIARPYVAAPRDPSRPGSAPPLAMPQPSIPNYDIPT